MSDADLRQLERDTERAPLEPRVWLAHAQAALRAGARDDAVASFHRAAALGGDLTETRRGLRALGAPPTPWGHPFGDSRRTRCSPLRGPRKGEVVARAKPSFGCWGFALAEDGTVHCCGDARGMGARLEGRTLASLPDLVGARSVEAAAGEGIVVLRRDDAPSVPELRVIREGQVETIGSPGEPEFANEPVIEGESLIVRRVREDGSAFCEVRATSSPRVVKRVLEDIPFYSHLATSPEEIVVASMGDRPSLTSLSWTGERRERFPLAGWLESGPVIDALGRILTVVLENGEWLLAACEGRTESWRHVSARGTSGRRGFASIAATPDGGVWLKTEAKLTRLDRDGSVRWSGTGGWGVPVADREGVVYSHQAPNEDERSLEARAPDGSLIFSIPGNYYPHAIDAWGRLLATDSAGHCEVIAVT